jgi:hypothetical protein
MVVIGAGLVLSSPFVTLSLYPTSHVAMMIYFFLGIFSMVWYTGPIIAVIHDVVPSDVKATAQALYILLIRLLGDTFSPAIVGEPADPYDLQGALLLPALINVVRGSYFSWGVARSAKRYSAVKICKRPHGTIYPEWARWGDDLEPAWLPGE